MGCQWAALYYPIFWSAIYLMLSILFIPKICLIFSKEQYFYKTSICEKGLITCMAWVLQDLCRIPVVCFGILGYLIYLISCPWLIGQVFTDSENRGYMTYRGWVVKTFNDSENTSILDLQISWWLCFPISSLWLYLLYWLQEHWLLKEESTKNIFYHFQARKKMMILVRRIRDQ